MDDFEQRLRSQPVRQVPAEWREEILSAAQDADSRLALTHHSFLSTITHQLSALLWPHPKAWAGLAAAWLVIFALNFASADKTNTVAKKTSKPSAEMVAALREQHLLLIELVGRTDQPDADRPKTAPPSPRSERRVELMVV